MATDLEKLLEKAKLLHGDLPLVLVNEKLEEFDEIEQEYITKYSGQYLIDLSKLDEDFSFNLCYVYSILEAAVEGHTMWSSSLKCSFTDTPDWWTDVLALSEDGRKVLTIDVELNH